MDIIVKFIVANEANAHIVSQMAKDYYAKTSGDKDSKEYSVAAFIDRASSFTREWLMAFETTGEDEEREEHPLVFLEVVSSNMPQEIKGENPLYIDKVVPSSGTGGLKEVLNRAVEIAVQRRHDLLWVKVAAKDNEAVEAIKGLGFSGQGEPKSGFWLLRKEV